MRGDEEPVGLPWRCHDKYAIVYLQIRDPRARQLARRLAQMRKVSMTDAVIDALEAELRRESESQPLADRLGTIADALRSRARPGGHEMSKQEVDAMWGHS